MFNDFRFMPDFCHMSSAAVERIALSDTRRKPVGFSEVMTAFAIVLAKFIGQMSTNLR